VSALYSIIYETEELRVKNWTDLVTDRKNWYELVQKSCSVRRRRIMTRVMLLLSMSVSYTSSSSSSFTDFYNPLAGFSLLIPEVK
jgi:hypothetical protein